MAAEQPPASSAFEYRKRVNEVWRTLSTDGGVGSSLTEEHFCAGLQASRVTDGKLSGLLRLPSDVDLGLLFRAIDEDCTGTVSKGEFLDFFVVNKRRVSDYVKGAELDPGHLDHKESLPSTNRKIMQQQLPGAKAIMALGGGHVHNARVAAAAQRPPTAASGPPPVLKIRGPVEQKAADDGVVASVFRGASSADLGDEMILQSQPDRTSTEAASPTETNGEPSSPHTPVRTSRSNTLRLSASERAAIQAARQAADQKLHDQQLEQARLKFEEVSAAAWHQLLL